MNYSLRRRDDVENEIITILGNHYRTCSGKPKPLQALREHYGEDFKFDSLGLGKYTSWMLPNVQHFKNEKKIAESVNQNNAVSMTEQQLLNIVILFFSKSDRYQHRKYVLCYLLHRYSNDLIIKFGYESFDEFLKKHDLDMGIADRQDFQSEEEWSQWTGRI